MVCNESKTEFMVINHEEINITVNGSMIESCNAMKVLGLTIDYNLGWETYINKVVSKLRSLSFALRYVRQHLSVQEMVPIINAHVISRIAYGAPVWQHNISFRQRAKLRSSYFRIIRLLLRDFNVRLSRSELLKRSGLLGLDTILYRRASVFIFNIIHQLEPTELATKLLSKGYYNDRSLGRLKFFDSSLTRSGRKCVTNAVSTMVEKWPDDWFFMSPNQFKIHLKDIY